MEKRCGWRKKLEVVWKLFYQGGKWVAWGSGLPEGTGVRENYTEISGGGGGGGERGIDDFKNVEEFLIVVLTPNVFYIF